MKISVCIPNFNYARYLRRTIESVLEQSHKDVEVIVSDNASTDDSVDVVRALASPKVRMHVNACNVGFARNLDLAAGKATGDRMIMLSSDDLIRPGALHTYQALSDLLQEHAQGTIFSSTWDIIDANDAITGKQGPDARVWKQSDRVSSLEAVVGAPVYRVEAVELFRRCAKHMKNPFNFATTCYARSLYEKVEGYGGGRLINPDKWFHWRLLGVAQSAVFIDSSLFAYRWHEKNQSAQQAATGSLKYLIDEYATTLEIDETLLQRAGLKRTDLERSFVENDILRHGFATLARGEIEKARRIFYFGQATYPWLMEKEPRMLAFSTLVRSGAAGGKLARLAYRFFKDESRVK